MKALKSVCGHPIVLMSTPQIAIILGAVCFVFVAFMGYKQRREQLVTDADVRTRFILASQQAGTGTMEIDPITARILYADDRTCRIFGYKDDGLNEQPLNLLLPSGFGAVHAQLLAAAMAKAKADPNAERVIIVKCQGVMASGKMVDVIIRAFLNPESSTTFAAINDARGVRWQDTTLLPVRKPSTTQTP